MISDETDHIVWCRQADARRIQVGVGERHLLTVAVDRAEFAPHPVGKTGVPRRVLGVSAGDRNFIACAEGRQVEADARVDAPAPGLLQQRR